MMTDTAYIFDMISRTIGQQLPGSVSVEYEEDTGYILEFHGDYDDLCTLPVRMDLTINENILVGDARQVEFYRNGGNYVARYHAYAVHQFAHRIPV